MGGDKSAYPLVLAIDPDPQGASWVMLEVDGSVVGMELQEPVELLVERIPRARVPIKVVVENLQSYGMPAGESMFETAKVIGEIRCVCRQRGTPYHEISRPTVKSLLCHSAQAKDSNVRRAVLDLYPPSGGGATPQIGTKAQKGPLYGFAADLWAALALGLVYLKQNNLGPLAVRDGLAESQR